MKDFYTEKENTMLKDLTVGDLIELATRQEGGQGASAPPAPGRRCLLKIGEEYFIRTVTQYYTGKLVDMDASFLSLEKAAWIPSTGGFSTALSTGELEEIEPMPHGTLVSLLAIVDISPWKHTLPEVQK